MRNLLFIVWIIGSDLCIVYMFGLVETGIRKLVESARVSRFMGGVILNLAAMMITLALIFIVNGCIVNHYRR